MHCTICSIRWHCFMREKITAFVNRVSLLPGVPSLPLAVIKKFEEPFMRVRIKDLRTVYDWYPIVTP